MMDDQLRVHDLKEYVNTLELALACHANGKVPRKYRQLAFKILERRKTDVPYVQPE